jgi:hypothetical protein
LSHDPEIKVGEGSGIAPERTCRNLVRTNRKRGKFNPLNEILKKIRAEFAFLKAHCILTPQYLFKTKIK